MQGKAQQGFTLIEVLIACVVLIVGILAVGSTVVAANRSAEISGARFAATGVARRVLEQARVTPATHLAPGVAQSSLVPALTDLPDVDAAASGWQVARGPSRFTVSVTSCNDDDPFDGYGARGAGYCTQGPASSPPDAQPTDFVQVSVVVAWTSNGKTRSVAQVSRIPAGSSGGGTAAPPQAGPVSMTAPTPCTSACPAVTSESITSVSLAARMPSSPASVEWIVNGNTAAACPPATTACAGSGADWTFQWNIGATVRSSTGMCQAGPYVYDGVHTVGIRGYDSAGRPGDVGSLPVTINRCAPIAPAGFEATGRDSNVPVIDTEWEASPEGDVIGYRVYRGTTPTERIPVCPPVVTGDQVVPLDAVRECTDPAPPSYSTSSDLYYGVYAVDRDPAGNLREGAIAFTQVNTGNRAPNAPTDLTASGSSPVTLSWTLPSVQDPDSGDSIKSFRIYRRAGTVSGTPTYADRIYRENKSVLCNGSACSFQDAAPLPTGTYWITAVDTHMRESAYEGPKTR